MHRLLAPFLLLLLPGAAFAQDTIDPTPLQNWVEEVKSIETLAANFKQTRKILKLRSPLKTSGNLWFQKPNKFRWELGSPPRTIAVHSGTQLTVMDTREKEAQVADTTAGENRTQFAAYFDLAFPQSWAEFNSRFKILELEKQGDKLKAELEPQDPESVSGVKAMTLLINAENQLSGFTLKLSDGSRIETEFTSFVKNVYMPTTQFKANLEGYAVKRGS